MWRIPTILDQGTSDARSRTAWGQRAHCLADDCEMSHEPPLQELVALESPSSADRIALDTTDGIQDIPKPLPGISHSGTASWRTRDRIRAFRPRSVTTSTFR